MNSQALAHALAGCLGCAATTGNSGGCSAGAVGAVVGELSAGYAKSTGATDANALAFARSMSAVAGALVGGPDGVAAVNVAAQITDVPPEKTRDQAVSDMLNGGSVQTGACLAGGCIGVNQSLGPKGTNPPTAFEFGIGTPGISVGTGASVNVYKNESTSGK